VVRPKLLVTQRDTTTSLATSGSVCHDRNKVSMFCLFYTANEYLPRHFVMIGVGPQLIDVFEESVFPLRTFGLQYADRKMLIRDVVREDGTRRRLTRRCGTQLDYPLGVHPTAAGVGPHTLIFLRAFPELVLSVLNLLPFSISPLTRCWGVVGCSLTLHLCRLRELAPGLSLGMWASRIRIPCAFRRLLWGLVVGGPRKSLWSLSVPFASLNCPPGLRSRKTDFHPPRFYFLLDDLAFLGLSLAA